MLAFYFFLVLESQEREKKPFHHFVTENNKRNYPVFHMLHENVNVNAEETFNFIVCNLKPSHSNAFRLTVFGVEFCCSCWVCVTCARSDELTDNNSILLSFIPIDGRCDKHFNCALSRKAHHAKKFCWSMIIIHDNLTIYGLS